MRAVIKKVIIFLVIPLTVPVLLLLLLFYLQPTLPLSFLTHIVEPAVEHFTGAAVTISGEYVPYW